MMLTSHVRRSAGATPTPRGVTIVGEPVVGQRLTVQLNGSLPSRGRYVIRWERCSRSCTAMQRSLNRPTLRLQRGHVGVRLRVSVYRKTAAGLRLVARSTRTARIATVTRTPTGPPPAQPAPSGPSLEPPTYHQPPLVTHDDPPPSSSPPSPSSSQDAAPSHPHVIKLGPSAHASGIDSILFSTPYGVSAVRALVDGVETPLVDVGFNPPIGIARFDTTVISDGEHTFELAITGSDGIERLTPPKTFIVDNTAPAPVTNLLITPAAGGTVTWDLPADNGASPLRTVLIRVCDEQTSECRKNQYPLQPPAELNLPSGTYTISVYVRDFADNQSAPASATVTIP